MRIYIYIYIYVFPTYKCVLCLCGNVNIYIYIPVCMYYTYISNPSFFYTICLFQVEIFLKVLPRTLCHLIQKRNEEEKF